MIVEVCHQCQFALFLPFICINAFFPPIGAHKIQLFNHLSILFNKYIFRTPIQNLHGFFNRKYSLVIIRQNYDDNYYIESNDIDSLKIGDDEEI